MRDRIVDELQVKTLEDLLWLETRDLQAAGLRLPEIRRFGRLQEHVKACMERASALTTVWSHALDDLRRNKPMAFELLTLLAWCVSTKKNEKRKKKRKERKKRETAGYGAEQLSRRRREECQC